MNNEIIILRSVYGKVGQTYTMNPCIDPNTGMYPPHIRSVDHRNDMIISDKDKSTGAIFLKETEEITITDGTIFDLKIPIQKARWEAIKNSPLIAPERNATDAQGNLLIDGSRQKWGIAVLYIERPGEDSQVKNSKKKLVTNACNYIFQSSKEEQITKCKLLGKDMRNAYASDVEDFLVNYAERYPQKIIDLYTGSDTTIRMMLIDSLNKGVIVQKGGIYMYGDRIALGVTDDSVVIWMKQPENQKVVELIKKETYPEMYPSEKDNDTKKIK